MNKNYSLRHLVVFLVSTSVVLTLLVSVIAGYFVSRDNLLDQSLEINRVYSGKLARITNLSFEMMLQNLSASSEEIKPILEDREGMRQHLKWLLQSGKYFNSVFFADSDGFVLASAPELGIVGKKLGTFGVRQALNERKPVISSPYMASTGRLIVLVSTPLFDGKGNYSGFLAGTIYLQERNFLQSILGEHFYENGSYVYVVDRQGNLIYHPLKSRISENVSENKAVQQLMTGKSGAQRVINTKGVDMLAGYTFVPTSGWGVVSQTPTEIALAPAIQLTYKILIYALPFIIVWLFIAWWAASKIVGPLQQLAYFAEDLVSNKPTQKFPFISTRYREARQLNNAIRLAVNLLQKQVKELKNEAQTDSLTGLYNRRMIDLIFKQLTDNGDDFSIILLDIDWFKRLNDTYGHQMGDEVLKFLARIMKTAARKEDYCCRFGGEEFMIILPSASLDAAYSAAERLRETIAATVSPTGESITVSLGVAHYPGSASNVEELVAQADESLYKAKKSGRNRTVMT